MTPLSPEQERAMQRHWKCVCGNDPCDGLDCGVYLRGQAPRRKPKPKGAKEMAAIRAKAWATRRARLTGKKGE